MVIEVVESSLSSSLKLLSETNNLSSSSHLLSDAALYPHPLPSSSHWAEDVAMATVQQNSTLFAYLLCQIQSLDSATSVDQLRSPDGATITCQSHSLKGIPNAGQFNSPEGVARAAKFMRLTVKLVTESCPVDSWRLCVAYLCQQVAAILPVSSSAAILLVGNSEAISHLGSENHSVATRFFINCLPSIINESFEAVFVHPLMEHLKTIAANIGTGTSKHSSFFTFIC